MFNAHGDWQYSIEPPIIYIKVIGCFNSEGVQARGYKRVDYLQPSLIAKNTVEHICQGSDMNIQFYPSVQSYLEDYPDYEYVKSWL